MSQTGAREGVMNRLVASFLFDERGATSIEYGVIALVISVSIMIGVTQVSGSVKGFYDLVAAAF
jgi:Flp pilus assembly pilin Flp